MILGLPQTAIVCLIAKGEGIDFILWGSTLLKRQITNYLIIAYRGY